MAIIDGGRIFAKALKKEGVECVFTLSGGHIMSILYGCRTEGIDVIDVRHESSAGYAANAYSVVTGKAGIFITTAGPGVTNATTAMAEAMETGIPMIHIGGASPQAESCTAPLQEVNSLETMAIFSKWAKKVVHSDRIPELVSQAFRQAYDSTPGPVYLEISNDVVIEKYEENQLYWPEAYRTDAQAFGEPEAIEKAADLLINADSPVMVVGDAARFCRGYEEYVEKLSNYLSMPVFALNTVRGFFADESENPLWTLGASAMFGADLILELGVNNTYLIGKGREPFFPESAKKIQIHPDKTKIGFNTRADVGIVADAGAAAKQLFETVSGRTDGPIDRSEWIKEAEIMTEEIGAPFIEAMTSDLMPPHPGRVAYEVAKFVENEDKDYHIIADGGDAAQWMTNLVRSAYAGQLVTYGPLGTIGTGQGFSIGAWAADKKPVVYYTGDGSFGFYSMEFDTYLRHGIPVICVISNDSAWGMIKLSENKCNPKEVEKNGYIACTLEHMRSYEKMTEIWGGTGIKVTKHEDIIPAMKKIAASGKPGIVNVQVDETKMSPATAEFGVGEG